MRDPESPQWNFSAEDAALRLTQARVKKCLTQQQVATALGIELRSYQRYESSESQLATASYKTGISICKLLDIEPFDLLRPLSEQFYAQHSGRSSRLNDKSQEVTYILSELGIPAHIKGYQYLKEAILLATEDMEIMQSVTKFLYPQVAVRFVTSPSRVERAIRHAIEVAYDRGDGASLEQLGDFKDKPTNSEFILITSNFLRNRSVSNPK